MQRWIWAVVAAAMTIGQGCTRQQGWEQKLEQDIRLSNQKAPQRVAEGVVFDSMAYESRAGELIYYYTMDDSLYTPRGIDEGRQEFCRNLLEELRRSLKFRPYKEKRLGFRYIYRAKSNDSVLIDELFTPNDYQ